MELSQLNPKVLEADCSGLIVGGDIKIGGQKRVCRCLYDGQAFVLKALMADTPTLRRVTRELQIMDRCRSPYLARLGPLPLREVVMATGERILYFLEEYVDGAPLASVPLPLAWREVVSLGLCVAEALTVLWDGGYIHRDVKPMNVMQRVDGNGYVLLDAGLAFIPHEDRITAPGYVAGTRAYLSPEQLTLAASALDFRSDLFALGITMYESATGEHPFYNDHTPTGDVIHNILSVNPPSCRTFNGEVPKELDEIIQRLLRKDRRARFESLTDFNKHLRQVLDCLV